MLRISDCPCRAGEGISQWHVPMRGLGVAVFLGVMQVAGGCTAARLTQFHNFAQAGGAYVKASQVVLDEAGTASIEADSLIAIKGRETLKTSEERRASISGRNEEV